MAVQRPRTSTGGAVPKGWQWGGGGGAFPFFEGSTGAGRLAPLGAPKIPKVDPAAIEAQQKVEALREKRKQLEEQVRLAKAELFDREDKWRTERDTLLAEADMQRSQMQARLDHDARQKEEMNAKFEHVAAGRDNERVSRDTLDERYEHVQRGELQLMSDRLHDAEESTAQLRRDFEDSQRRWHGHIKSLQQDNQRLRAEIASRVGGMHGSKDAMEVRVERAVRERDEMRVEKDAADERLHTLQSGELQGLSDRAMELEEICKKLRVQRDGLQDARYEIMTRLEQVYLEIEENRNSRLASMEEMASLKGGSGDAEANATLRLNSSQDASTSVSRDQARARRTRYDVSVRMFEVQQVREKQAKSLAKWRTHQHRLTQELFQNREKFGEFEREAIIAREERAACRARWRQHLEELRSRHLEEIKATATTMTELRMRTSTAEAEASGATGTLKDLTAQIENLEQMNLGLEAQVQDAVHVMEEIRRQMTSITEVFARKRHDLEGRQNSLRDEMQQTSGEMSSAQSALLRRVERAEDECASLKVERDGLVVELHKLKQAEIPMLTEKLQQEQETSKRLADVAEAVSTQIKAADQQAEAAERDADEARNQLYVANEELATLRGGELASKKAHLKQLIAEEKEKSTVFHTNENAMLRSRQGDLEGELADLREDRDKASRELEGLRAGDLARLEARCQHELEHGAELQGQLRDIQRETALLREEEEVRGEVTKMGSTHRFSIGDIGAIVEQPTDDEIIKQVEAYAATLQKHGAEPVPPLQKQLRLALYDVANRSRELKRLRHDMAQAERKWKEEKKDMYHKVRVSVESDNQQAFELLQKENQRLQGDIHKQQKRVNAEMARLKNRCLDLAQELENAQMELAARTRDLELAQGRDLPELQRQNSELNQARDTLMRERDEAVKKLMRALEKIEVIEDERKGLKSELKASEKIVRGFDEAKVQWAIKLEDKESEITGLEKQKLQGDSSWTDEVTRRDQKLEQMDQDFVKTQTSRRRAIQHQDEKIATLNATVGEIVAEKEQLEKTISELNDETIVLLKARAKDTEARGQQLKEEMRALEETMKARMEDEEEAGQRAHKRLEKEWKKMSEEREGLRKKVEHYKQNMRFIQPTRRTCRNCKERYGETENYNWSCRTHFSEWAENGQEGGVWWCCGARGKKALGCHYQKHIPKQDEHDDEEGPNRDHDDGGKHISQCAACKDYGHSESQCPKDPNFRTNFPMEDELERLERLKLNAANDCVPHNRIDPLDMCRLINAKLGYEIEAEDEEDQARWRRSMASRALKVDAAQERAEREAEEKRAREELQAAQDHLEGLLQEDDIQALQEAIQLCRAKKVSREYIKRGEKQLQMLIARQKLEQTMQRIYMLITGPQGPKMDVEENHLHSIKEALEEARAAGVDSDLLTECATKLREYEARRAVEVAINTRDVQAMAVALKFADEAKVEKEILTRGHAKRVQAVAEIRLERALEESDKEYRKVAQSTEQATAGALHDLLPNEGIMETLKIAAEEAEMEKVKQQLVDQAKTLYASLESVRNLELANRGADIQGLNEALTVALDREITQVFVERATRRREQLRCIDDLHRLLSQEDPDIQELEDAVAAATQRGVTDDILAAGTTKLEKMRGCESLETALMSTSVDVLEKAIDDARTMKVDRAVIEDAQRRLVFLRAQEALTEVMRGDNVEDILACIENATTASVPPDEINRAWRRVKQIEAGSRLLKALESKDVEAVEAEMREAEKVGLSRNMLEDAELIVQQIKAIEMLKGVCGDNADKKITLAAVEEAVEFAQSVGVGEMQGEGTIYFSQALSKRALQRAERELRFAGKQGDIHMLRAAIQKAEEVGVEEKKIISSKAKFDKLSTAAKPAIQTELKAAIEGSDAVRLDDAILIARAVQVDEEIIAKGEAKLKALRGDYEVQM